jgi:hypothetical protein
MCNIVTQTLSYFQYHTHNTAAEYNNIAKRKYGSRGLGQRWPLHQRHSGRL